MFQSFFTEANSTDTILQTVTGIIKKGGRVIIQNESLKDSVEEKRYSSYPKDLEDWNLEIDPQMLFFLFKGNTEICTATNMKVSSCEKTYRLMAVEGGKPIAVASGSSTLLFTFTCSSTLETGANYYLSNKYRLNIPIVIRSVVNNVVTATVSQ